MGLLFNQAYWASTVNELLRTRPDQNKVMLPPDRIRYLALLCSAFTDLHKDPDLRFDLNVALGALGSEQTWPSPTTPAFAGFVQVFERLEQVWLFQSGISLDAVADVIQAIRGTYSKTFSPGEGPDPLVSAIEKAAKVCCAEQRQVVAAQIEEARASAASEILKGVAVVAVNLVPPAIPAVQGMVWAAAFFAAGTKFSLKSGFELIKTGASKLLP